MLCIFYSFAWSQEGFFFFESITTLCSVSENMVPQHLTILCARACVCACVCVCTFHEYIHHKNMYRFTFKTNAFININILFQICTDEAKKNP